MGWDRSAAGDGAVVQRVLHGDAEAYGVLIERYRRQFGRYATAMCGDTDRAADAMQEAFIRAYDSLASCRDPNRFGAWFFRILTNQCHNHRDRARRHLALDGVSLSGRENPERDLEAAEIRRAIDRALDTLSPDLRETFVLREIEGRSYGEMAELLDTAEPALRKRVERARETVRHALEEWL